MNGRPSDPLALAGQRLNWLEQRQKVLAQNIANANSPGYQPRDLQPFEELVQRAGATAPLARTDARHIPARTEMQGRPDRKVTERSPDGNAVSLEEQALKVAATDQAHALAVNLHRRWTAMFQSALGRGG